MILKFLDSNLDGNSWEKLCISCYRMKYEGEHFQEVPANHKGDGGIEGFTKSGVVIQCYCPNDMNLSNDDLYKNQRNKVTDDINKFIDVKNSQVLKKIGIPIIKEWHFVVPEYKDKRILEHIKVKKDLVLTTKKNKDIYSYISEDFEIVIKVAEDFRVELSRIIRSELTDVKLSVAILQEFDTNWTESNNEKIENVRRKILAINPTLEADTTSLNKVLNIYMTAYLKGIELLEHLGQGFPDIRKDLLDLANQYKIEVETRTLLNSDKTLNAKLFNELGNDFQEKLEKEFKYLNSASIMSLKNDLIAGWLADCSMEFKGEVRSG